MTVRYASRMTRRGAVPVTVGGVLVVVHTAIACGSFEDGGAVDGSDAAPESSAPDATSGTDADAASDAVAVPETFCAMNATSASCDDFEQPGRDLSVAAPWDDGTTTGSLDVEAAVGQSALTVGTRGSGVEGEVDVSIDNVLVTTF